MKLEKIIARAKKNGRIENGLVLCDNCDTPASKTWARKMGWVGCAPCYFGEASSFDMSDLIHVNAPKGKKA